LLVRKELDRPLSPLLFVICMEYFSRLMKGGKSGFSYHQRWLGLQ